MTELPQLIRTPIINIERCSITNIKRIPITGIRYPIVKNQNKLISPVFLSKEELLERFTPLMRSIYKLFCSYNGVFVQSADYEDLYSQIQYEFLRLCKEYDPDRGVDFPGYIKFHLQNRVYHFVTKEQKHRQKEQPIKAYGSNYEEKLLDMENFSDLIDLDTVKQLERAEAIASLDWRAIVGKKHKALIEGILFRKKTLEELAEEEGVSIKVLRLRLHFACVRLREWAKEMEDYVKFHNESKAKKEKRGK